MSNATYAAWQEAGGSWGAPIPGYLAYARLPLRHGADTFNHQRQGVKHFLFVAACAPDSGRTAANRRAFWQELRAFLATYFRDPAHTTVVLILAGDLNAEIGRAPLPDIIGPHSPGPAQRSENGEELVALCRDFTLCCPRHLLSDGPGQVQR